MFLVLAYIPLPSHHRILELIHSSGMLLMLVIISLLSLTVHRRWVCYQKSWLIMEFGFAWVCGVLVVLGLVEVRFEFIIFNFNFSRIMCYCPLLFILLIDLALVSSHFFLSDFRFLPFLSQSLGGRHGLLTWVRCLSSISRVMARTGSSWRMVQNFEKGFGVRSSFMCLCLRGHPLGVTSSLDSRVLISRIVDVSLVIVSFMVDCWDNFRWCLVFSFCGNLTGWAKMSRSLRIGNLLSTNFVSRLQIRVLIIPWQRIGLCLRFDMMLILDYESGFSLHFWSYHSQIRTFQSHRIVTVRQIVRRLMQTCLIRRFKYASECVDFMVDVPWFHNWFVGNFHCRTLALKRSRPSFVRLVDFVKFYNHSYEF